MDVYVANFPYSTTQEQIRALFEPFGAVDEVKIVRDRDSGRSKGYGFVMMPNANQAKAAIAQLDGQAMGDRPLRVGFGRKKH